MKPIERRTPSPSLIPTGFAMFALLTVPHLGLAEGAKGLETGAVAGKHGSGTTTPTGQPSLTGEIVSEQARQADLLARLKDEPVPLTAEFPAPTQPVSLDSADPRVAAAAPVERSFPVEIFDESLEEIEAGRWSDSEARILVRRELDADGDGHPELVRWHDPDTDQLLHQSADLDFDGVTDAWSTYRDGHIVSRELDSDGEGRLDVFESYAGDRLTRLEIDRDRDGIRDLIYLYEGEDLVQEIHDSNNDGQPDRVVHYVARTRVRAEEDTTFDGQFDTWTEFESVEGKERIVRIERDLAGRGFADTFEIYEVHEGRALLARKDEDTNGDGEIDVISHYQAGKLRRRVITRPEDVSRLPSN